jgi:competence protein ComEC
MTRMVIALLSAAILTLGASAGQTPGSKTLDIYVTDTEGGQATLFLTPTRETVLLDTGNPGDRDHQRMLEVIKAAGVARIDHLVITHYHSDHVGGLAQLAQAIPIAHYIDHGPSIETREPVQGFQTTYAELVAKARHTVVKPGDRLPLSGVDWLIVSAHGQVLPAPLPGAGQTNTGPCEASPSKAYPPNDDNAMSVGSLVSFGAFKALQLGDLFWDLEKDLVCPVNKLGTVDVYLTTHHGLDSSGAPALVHGVRPRVAVMHNGPRKGGSAATLRTLWSSPGLEDVWTLHWSHYGLLELNPPALFVANIDAAETVAGLVTAPPAARRGGNRGGAGAGDAAHSPAYWIKISAQTDGTFTVTNTRNGFSKTYSK